VIRVRVAAGFAVVLARLPAVGMSAALDTAAQGLGVITWLSLVAVLSVMGAAVVSVVVGRVVAAGPP